MSLGQPKEIDAFVGMYPQQYVALYGAFSQGLFKNKKPFHFSTLNEGQIDGEIAEAKSYALAWLETKLAKGVFSFRERTKAINVLNDLSYDHRTHTFTYSSESRAQLFHMAQLGYFVINERVNSETVITATIAIKEYHPRLSPKKAAFNSEIPIFGAELMPPEFLLTEVLGDSSFMAEYSEKLSRIRHRASSFYTEWLRGQIKILARANEQSRMPD